MSIISIANFNWFNNFLNSSAEIVQIFALVFRKIKDSKSRSEINWTLNRAFVAGGVYVAEVRIWILHISFGFASLNYLKLAWWKIHF